MPEILETSLGPRVSFKTTGVEAEIRVGVDVGAVVGFDSLEGGAVGLEMAEGGAVGFDMLEGGAVELDISEGGAVELDASEGGAVELDASENEKLGVNVGWGEKSKFGGAVSENRGKDIAGGMVRENFGSLDG